MDRTADAMHEKYGRLLDILRGMDGVVVAFSGGVDSALLLAAAREAQGDRALAVTARSSTYTDQELEDARRIAATLGVRHRIVETAELEDARFRANPPDRCYWCKRELFRTLAALALEEGLACVAEGSNTDDAGDYRPGRRAKAEFGARSPMVEAGLSKGEIRALAREKGLHVWGKPAAACLASRIPYGEEITPERLGRVGRAEASVRSLGFEQVRVRDHGTVARIEVAAADVARFADPALRQRVVAAVKEAGYPFVALDLEGYRTGAMNEILDARVREEETR